MNAPLQSLAISLGVMQRNSIFFLLPRSLSDPAYVSLGLPSRPKNSFRQPSGARLRSDSLCCEPSFRTSRVLLCVLQGSSQVVQFSDVTDTSPASDKG